MAAGVIQAGDHQHRIPLGLLMLNRGLINQNQLHRALDAQRRAGTGKIGEWLVQECGVSSTCVTQGLAYQWSCPVLPIDGFSSSSMSLIVPRMLVEQIGLIPLRVAGARFLYVAFKDRLDASIAYALERMSGLQVVSGLLEEAIFNDALRRILDSDFAAIESQRLTDLDTLAEKISGVLVETAPIGSHLVRIHNHYWLRLWLEAGAYSGVGRLPRTGEDVKDVIYSIGSPS